MKKNYIMSSPKSQTADVLTAQFGEALLGRFLQVVGALVIDHHGQYETHSHTVHILRQATTLILTAVCVKPAGMKGCEEEQDKDKKLSQHLQFNLFLGRIREDAHTHSECSTTTTCAASTDMCWVQYY